MRSAMSSRVYGVLQDGGSEPLDDRDEPRIGRAAAESRAHDARCTPDSSQLALRVVEPHPVRLRHEWARVGRVEHVEIERHVDAVDIDERVVGRTPDPAGAKEL